MIKNDLEIYVAGADVVDFGKAVVMIASKYSKPPPLPYQAVTKPLTYLTLEGRGSIENSWIEKQ